MSVLGARAALAFLWLFHWLPLGMQAAIGRAVGRLLYAAAGSRRRIAQRNLELCFPDMPPAEREALVRQNFEWVSRSILERGLLWYGSAERLKRLIHVEGDIGFAAATDRPVMWLVPHFVGLEIAGTASALQPRRVVSMYQTQSNAVFDAALKAGRLRWNNGDLLPRHHNALPLVKAIKRGMVFLNLPDMDFGARDAAFVPFFGVPAATLLAPSRLAKSLHMVVQPVVTEVLPGGQGYKVRYLPPWDDFPTEDAEADTLRMNRWIESEILRNPAQYLWVHKRFKTRPPGEKSFY
ncbi:LpxL/LpxP family acyltransferase [Ideonella sp. BN130291]|uniref:LpxL/LpxP family acyltransferase n=1 Tax=Ideonella sp. BN130291 TaxID=3112940 RepID=UPI002E253A68|nr:lipid A biosynthesis acyltransferase [Ideonella sp. BN130291]